MDQCTARARWNLEIFVSAAHKGFLFLYGNTRLKSGKGSAY